MINVGYESSRLWKIFVNECFDTGGGKMFHNIAIEDKAYLSVTNEHLGTYRHSPRKQLEYQVSLGEPGWHRISNLINKGIKNMMDTIVKLAKSDTETVNTFDVDTYNRSLKGYGTKKARGIDVWTSGELNDLQKEGKYLCQMPWKNHSRKWHNQYKTSYT